MIENDIGAGEGVVDRTLSAQIHTLGKVLECPRCLATRVRDIARHGSLSGLTVWTVAVNGLTSEKSSASLRICVDPG